MNANGLRPYPAYRDSGVEWLGKVPEHWEVRRLGATTERLVAGTWGSDPTGHDDIVCVRVADFDRRRLGVNLRKPTVRSVPAGERQRRLLEPGDLLLEKSGGGDLQPVGVVVHFDHDQEAVASNFIGRMRVRRQHSARYVLYLNSVLYAIRLTVRSIKQTTGIQNLDVGAYLSESVPLPPLSEQTPIARFLEAADRCIRRYIRAKERLVELLEERKRALIHEAVTGRIDVRTGQPYPAYKDSGVEWLGKVPEHWLRCRLTNVVSEVTTGSRGWSSYAADDGPLFVRVANLSRGSLELRLEDAVRLDLPVTSEASRTRIAEGDLLLSVTAYIGSVGVAPEGLGEAYVSQHVARCRPSPAVASKWLGYVLLSSLGQTYGQTRLYGGTKDGLSLDDVRNYPILLPSPGEQRELVRWIERRLSLLGKLRDATQRQIALLREYRTRLIADVVTGKLDVREAAARLPETDPFTGEHDRPNPIHTESSRHSTAHDMAKDASA